MIFKKEPVFLLLFILFAAVGARSQNAEIVKTASEAIPAPTSPDGDERYRIGYQDKLDIQVFRHPELNQKVSVNTNGTINLYRVPEPIVAVCRTERELGDAIADAYRKSYLKNPEVLVVAVEQKSQAFMVIGAVQNAGSYFINKKVRLLELLAYAGGPSKEAGSTIIVARTGSSSNCRSEGVPETEADEKAAVMTFKLRDILEAKQNIAMQPGDVVSVMKADVVYVYGNVQNQGQVEMKEPITLTQAIASAKGLKPSTKQDRIRILRQKDGSLEREELVFDLHDIDKNKVQDPYLQPNDIVAVSEDKTKSILNGIKNSLTQGVSTVFYRFP